MTTQSTSANRKALLTHLTVAGGAALISTTANAQIMKVLVNQEVGYAPGDLTSFTSALPGTNQFIFFDLGAQLVDLARLDEVGDVVVGVIAAVGADQPVADSVGRRQSGKVAFAAEDRGGFLAGHVGSALWSGGGERTAASG